ncbi:MAG: ATP-binding protein [Methanophagales archaeon]|nr:ATP-binding protein [Methanophagales archaeon]
MATEEMKEDKIEAIPTKRLFIDILTRDISVRACILDLIDNSVDAYIRNELSVRREIRLNISKDEFEIFDNCGGIEYNFLKTTVFRFGADIIERDKPTLGIYGIGLKRAILKIGKTILMETDDGNKY